MSRGSSVVDMPRIPTGSLSLDVETAGGLPIGRITTFSGNYSDGKTAVVLKVVAEFQKLYPGKEIVWIDAEGAWNKHWVRVLGVDPDSVYLVHPEYSQQAFDIAEQCITADCGLLVIDSIAALVPKEEAEATMEDWQVGLAARINNKFIRRTHSSLNDKRISELPPTVILINQLRESIGGYGGGDTEPGGKGIGFAASLRIKLRKGDLYPPTTSNYGPVVPKAQQIKFYIEKSKVSAPRRNGHFWFYFDTLDEYRAKGSYDRLEEIIRYARKYNIVQQNTSIFTIPNPDTGEELKFKGSSALADYIRTDRKARMWIEERVKEEVIESHDREKQGVLDGNKEHKETREQSSEEVERKETAGVR